MYKGRKKKTVEGVDASNKGYNEITPDLREEREGEGKRDPNLPSQAR